MAKSMGSMAVSCDDLRRMQKVTLNFMKIVRTNVRMMIPFYDGHDMEYIDGIMEDATRMLVGTMTKTGSVEEVDALLHEEDLDELAD